MYLEDDDQDEVVIPPPKIEQKPKPVEIVVVKPIEVIKKVEVIEIKNETEIIYERNN